jgi:hypothetical protein
MRTGDSRIVGIRLGELEIDLIRGFPAIMKAKFALLRDDGAHCGQVTKEVDWSDKTSTALQALAEALEEDIFAEVFKGIPGAPDSVEQDELNAPTEPKQF